MNPVSKYRLCYSAQGSRFFSNRVQAYMTMSHSNCHLIFIAQSELIPVFE